MSLCFRCEKRAEYLEGRGAMRYECGCVKMAVHSCYGYKPVMPLIVKPAKGDRRPMFAGTMISARVQSVGVAEGGYRAFKNKKGYIVYFYPAGIDDVKTKKDKI